MKKSGIDLVELGALVDEIKSGKRVVLFPPGQSYFISTIILALLAFSLATVFITSALTNDLPMHVRATTQFFSTILIIPIIVFPGVMITRGKKRFSAWLRVAFIFFILSTFFVAVRNVIVHDLEFSFMVFWVWAVSSIGYWLSRRPGFNLYCEFFSLLKK